MSTGSRFVGGVLTFYDKGTFEQVSPLAPVMFEDDFIGSATLVDGTTVWTAIDAGDATEARVADDDNGVMAMSLTSTSQAQQAGLSFGDELPFVSGNGLIFEARVMVSTTPTLEAEAVWGLASDTNAVNDSVANNAWFKVDGSTAVLCETDDASTAIPDIATGITAGTTDWRIYRIDATDAADVKFYIDGTRVAGSTTFTALTTQNLQPYFHMVKASGGGLGVLEVDYCRVWQNRS